MNKKIHLKDESGDKKYFTIIPNYILNHSTLWDREVYIQMKRITGEDGTCWTSQNTLAKQCGISINRLKKSLVYLIEHKWISFIGKKEVQTIGGKQEVNEYRIADLWKLNIDYYETKGVSYDDIPIEQRGITAEAKGVSPGDDKEEPNIKKNPLISKVNFADTNIKSLLNSFKEINPSYERLFVNKTQRAALERLIKKYTPEKVSKMIGFASSIHGKQYAPTISTPLQLENKLGDLIAYYKKESANQKFYIKI